MATLTTEDFVPGMGTPFAMISNKSLLIIGSNRFFDDDLELNFNLLVNLEDTGQLIGLNLEYLLNDNWFIENIDAFYPNAQIKIHNRWGQLIYEHKNGNYLENMWNGTYEGENLPMGAYYFIINCNDEANKTMHGAVLIKR